MSPTANKRKGRKAEQQVAEYLRAQGFDLAERRILAGANDRGDIAGVPGLTIEVKATKTIDLSGGLAELDVERANTGDPHGLLVVKRRGTLDVGRWYAVQEMADWLRLWEGAHVP